MQIRINQTRANSGHVFEIILDDKASYHARTSWISGCFQSVLTDPENTTILKTEYSTKIGLKNAIPLKWIFGIPQVSKSCAVMGAGGAMGAFWRETTGLLKSCYVVDFDGVKLRGYCTSRGKTSYVSLYDASDTTQVALLVRPLDATNEESTYTLYLLDTVNCDPVVLAFFAVYYDNWIYAKGTEATRGSETNWKWTSSPYNDKYDPAWLSKYFSLS
ncbi:MAG: hypothetical protein VB086_07245 [Clostridiaceae bacterium]|nr:hypothetical protein [Clostridiaceae bacterium]